MSIISLEKLKKKKKPEGVKKDLWEHFWKIFEEKINLQHYSINAQDLLEELDCEVEKILPIIRQLEDQTVLKYHCYIYCSKCQFKQTIKRNSIKEMNDFLEILCEICHERQKIIKKEIEVEFLINPSLIENKSKKKSYQMNCCTH